MKERWPAWAGMLLLAGTKLAVAASFSLSPLGVSIPSRDTSASVVAENTGGAPLVIQVRTMAWRQADGNDVRDDTRELIVNPPIFKLNPGERQLVRVASRNGPPADVERAYRVVFSEVAPDQAPRTQPGFRFTLAMDIPVYVEPAAPAAPAAVRWQAARTDKGIRVTAENPGNVHYRIVDAEFGVAGRVLQKPGLLVVLPQSSRNYDLPAVPPGTAAIHLTAEDGASHPVSVDIPLSPAR
jgi:fimbrial chaperone protein